MCELLLLAVELQSHRDLVNATLNFTLEDESDEQFLNFVDLDVQLLKYPLLSVHSKTGQRTTNFSQER